MSKTSLSIQRLIEGRSGLQVGREDHDARVVGPDAQFLFGTEHAFGDFPPDFRQLDRVSARDDRTHGGQGDEDPLPDIRRTAYDGQRFLSDADLAEGKLVRIRMTLRRHDPGHQDPAEVGPFLLQGINLQAGHGQTIGQLLRRDFHIHVIFQPLEGDFHPNCSRKRQSFSKKRRMSLMPYLSMVMRSHPETERESRHFIGIVADILEDFRIDHARPQDLQPSALAADTAARTAEHDKRYRLRRWAR